MVEYKMAKSLMKTGAGILIGVGLGVLILLGLGLGGEWFAPGQGSTKAINSPFEGAHAPDFELYNLVGEKVRLTELQGKVVLINFWATWCGPCRVEMPLLQTYAQRHTEDMVLLAVNAKESEQVVEGFVRSLDLTFDVLLDPTGEVQKLYQLRGYPTTFFIDREGVIRVQHIGVLTENQLSDYLVEVGVPR